MNTSQVSSILATKRRSDKKHTVWSTFSTTLLSWVCWTLLLCVSNSQAFVVPSSSTTTTVRRLVPRTTTTLLPTTTTPATTTTTTTTTTSLALSWQDVVYHAESAASHLAAASLTTTTNDPSLHVVTSLPVMYGAGLLTSLSPCVWGLLPLTMSYISNAAGERADHKTTWPTVAFAAGLATVFCTLGVTAAQLGGVFGATTSSGSSSSNNNAFIHDWNVMGILSNLIVVIMGLQLLELIKIPLPSLVNPGGGGALSSSLTMSKNKNNQPILLDGTGQILDNNNKNPKSDDGTTNSSESGSLFRTFLLGGSSALVASPCATPVLTSILAFVAKTQNPILGAALLFTYTLGYSTPLLLIASTGGQALVDLRQRANDNGGLYATLAPWVTPFTGGILLWYGTNGFLTALLGDPSLAGLQVLEQ